MPSSSMRPCGAQIELAQRDTEAFSSHPATPAAQPLAPQLPLAEWQRVQTTLAVLQVRAIHPPLNCNAPLQS